jgi:hypothetical protein
MPIVPGSAQKREPPEPDILCSLPSGEALAFELAEACAPEFASAITNVVRGEIPIAIYGEDVSGATLKRKLSKTYSDKCDVDLLLYTNGRRVLPDDAIIPALMPIVENGIGQYRRVWFFGESVHLIAMRGS